MNQRVAAKNAPPEEWGPFPWRGGGPPGPWRQHAPGWEGKRRFLFRRALAGLMLLTASGIGGMALLALLVTRLFEGSGHTALMIWLGGCALLITTSLLIIAFGMHAYRRYVNPLAEIMAAADAVADGDLSVRVPERAPGEFGRLTRSFNRMAGELERNDQQRRNLTADVAHELRTPLHIIQGNLEGIIDGVYTASPEQLEAMLDETYTLARIVADLQTLAQAETGQLAFTREEVQVDGLLTDLQAGFGPWAKSKDIALEVACSDSGLLVEADAGRLDQALSNLVGNAIRHTPAGGAILLAAGRQASRIFITVQDNGEGIPEADLPYIFDRFWRGDRSRTRQEGSGSGLGLAIARQIIVQHGGTIHVASQAGEGTRFTVTLPGV
ncbi:MAG: HAMP domain-containing protein [Caldilineaceae bacterium]|nr:HAMP domain-containing protein [Caldilineaceae bacterium]